MNRRIVLPVLLGTALFGVVPAFADANGSSEQRSVDRSCSAGADNRYSAPASNDCRNADGSPNPGGTYRATYWSNDVQCGDKNRPAPALPNGTSLYASGDPAAQNGSAGMCSQGGGTAPAPVQGRTSVSGNRTDGFRVVVDGDKDNANETAQGYVVVQQAPAPTPPSYRCGDEYSQGGKADSDTPESRDTSAECGG